MAAELAGEGDGGRRQRSGVEAAGSNVRWRRLPLDLAGGGGVAEDEATGGRGRGTGSATGGGRGRRSLGGGGGNGWRSGRGGGSGRRWGRGRGGRIRTL
ncbi:hypothetical protein DAI22_03g157200 [Oryza sativa Japonica Group]|nr:hypothetical protein DAI22_03g157200 [Oryza sativa Japonica Group]